jgi:hypothetical protein
MYLNNPKSTAMTNSMGNSELNKGSRVMNSKKGTDSLKRSFGNELAPPP